jgi:hypothetical protein
MPPEHIMTGEEKEQVDKILAVVSPTAALIFARIARSV